MHSPFGLCLNSSSGQTLVQFEFAPNYNSLHRFILHFSGILYVLEAGYLLG